MMISRGQRDEIRNPTQVQGSLTRDERHFQVDNEFFVGKFASFQIVKSSSVNFPRTALWQRAFLAFSSIVAPRKAVLHFEG
jgi:hypothetical protein